MPLFTGKGKIRAAGSDEAGAGRVKEADYTGESGKMIAYNVSNQKNYALRVVPLFLKKPAIKLVYLMSAKATTTTITNMGQMMVDEAYRPYIKRFQIILSPSAGQNTKATVCSYGDELTFTFSSLLKDTSVQKVFLEVLRRTALM